LFIAQTLKVLEPEKDRSGQLFILIASQKATGAGLAFGSIVKSPCHKAFWHIAEGNQTRSYFCLFWFSFWPAFTSLTPVVTGRRVTPTANEGTKVARKLPRNFCDSFGVPRRRAC